MAVLNIKSVPDKLYRKLQARAKRQRRSVAQEVIQILDQALSEPPPLSILDLQSGFAGAWEGDLAGDQFGSLHPTRASGVGLIEALGSGPVAVDTPPIIYLIEEHPHEDG
jgi:plasmid stability protein